MPGEGSCRGDARARAQVGARDQVVAVRQRRVGHVDHHPATDEPPERDLVRSLAALGEVHRRVEVGAAVLCRPEVVRRVPVAPGRVALGDLLEREALGRRPVDRLGVERIGEIHDLAPRNLAVAARRLLGAACRARPSDHRAGRDERRCGTHPPEHPATSLGDDNMVERATLPDRGPAASGCCLGVSVRPAAARRRKVKHGPPGGGAGRVCDSSGAQAVRRPGSRRTRSCPRRTRTALPPAPDPARGRTA